MLLLSSDLQELLPGIINQLGPDNLASLKTIADQYSNSAAAAAEVDADDDDEVPELEEDFDAVAVADQ